MSDHLINQQRLGDTFAELVRIDSVSREEGGICRDLQARLADLGGVVRMDGAGPKVGGDCGNLIATFAGNRAAAPLLLSAHMDTVEPGRGVVPRFENGVFTSRGDTILGADDKCGLAIILEALTAIQDHSLPCGPLEVVFSVCEEVGLLGAKHLDYDLLSAKIGYVLDTRNPNAIITRAPAANRLRFTIHGRAAHAGAEPEKGINAIALAGQAIARLDLGRMDRDTTCNIGLIRGGVATNVVPAEAVVEGEVRSHDKARLKAVTDAMVGAFEQVVGAFDAADGGHRPVLTVAQDLDFDLFVLTEDAAVVRLARQAAAGLGRKLYRATSGGGSDANILAAHGIAAGVLGTGCEKVHTVDERVALSDMVRATRLLLEIIQIHAQQQGEI